VYANAQNCADRAAGLGTSLKMANALKTPPPPGLVEDLRQTPGKIADARPCRVFIPFTTPFLYGMERAVIELFDALRPDVEPYFLQGSLIFKDRPPVIREMLSRGFSISLLPDKHHWPRLARPKSIRHLYQMLKASLRVNIAILKGARSKDVLYVPGISAGSSSLLAALLYRVTGRRVIHHFHDLGTNNLLFPLWIRLVTDFIHNTEFGYKDIVQKLPGIKRKHNFIVPYILEVDERLPEDPEVCQWFTGKRNLFFVGQISSHKGVDILLKAFNLIAAKYPDVLLHLVGGCGDGFRQELDREMTSAGYRNRVRFWGFREDATRLMRFAYVYVHTSPPSRFHESFGRSVVEAMAHGVPTVCFRSGALQEIVLHEKTGLVCEESASSLASALNRFLEERNFREACGKEARQRYEQEYSSVVVRPRWARVMRAKGETEET
jgi:glycosyltransferase involved in cell wall biosynthesis